MTLYLLVEQFALFICTLQEVETINISSVQERAIRTITQAKMQHGKNYLRSLVSSSFSLCLSL